MAISSSGRAPLSSTSPTPRSTASVATETSVQRTSEPGSTIFSVTVVPATSPGETRTITTQPTATLSKPVVSTITNSNGSHIITTPGLVTIWSTSTNNNGTIVTATAVVANPPQTDLSPASGILHNTGAVAGIFSVVGVIFASLVVCLIVYLRRRYRSRQHEKWLAGMETRHANDDPFHDENLPPVIHSIHTIVEEDHWNQKGTITPEDSSHSENFGQTKGAILPVYLQGGTFEKRHLQSIDIESPTEPDKARRSWAPSTPSIYPDSLSPEDEPVLNIVPNSNQSVTTSPPRPPRSRLRGRGIRVLGSTLPTPPESEYSNPTSLISELHSVHILDRMPSH